MPRHAEKLRPTDKKAQQHNDRGFILTDTKKAKANL